VERTDRRGWNGLSAIPTWGWAVLVLVVASLLRTVYVLQVGAGPVSQAPVLDEFELLRAARAIADGNWIGDGAFFRGPLYPYLLAGILKATGGRLLAARLVQANLAALTSVAVLFVARRVVDRRWAVAAAALAAVHPIFIYFSHELLIVSVATLLNVLFVLAILRADEVPTWTRWMGAGAVGGLAALARANVLVFLPCVIAWVWMGAAEGAPTATGRTTAVGGATRSRTSLLRVSLLLLGTAIVIAPVTLRNSVLSGDFVPIASQGGVNFYIGNNKDADGISAAVPELGETWSYAECVRIAEIEEGRTLTPSEVSRFWYRRGMGFIRREPGAAARLFVKKLVLFWDRHELANTKDIGFFGAASPVFRALRWLGFGLIAPLALAGIVFGRRRGAVLLMCFVLSYMVGLGIFFVNARYRLPAVPFVIVLGVLGASWLWGRARARDTRSLVAGGAVLLVAALFVNCDLYGTHREYPGPSHFTLGRALASTGRYEEALVEYRKAIEILPTHGPAHNNLGVALEEIGRRDEAYEAYTEAARLDTTLASAPMNIGRLHRLRGEYERAAKWFAEASRRAPRSVRPRVELGAALLMLGEMEEAERSLRRALELDERDAEAWNTLGLVLEETGRTAEAIGAYGRAVALVPGFVGARNNLGVVLVKTGQYAEAVVEFECARSLAPGDSGIARNLRKTRGLLRDRGRAGEAP